MALKLFLLGRPGSGKTTAFHIIEKMAPKVGKKATRFREYTILRGMLQQEGYKDKFRPTAHGGFDILDLSVFYESAKRLENEIQTYLDQPARSHRNEFVVIELARGDYSEAMNCFSPGFLKDAYFLFIDADLDTCIKRIQYRVAHPKKTDGHYISGTIMRSYYAKDNLPYMDFGFKRDHRIQTRVITIENTGSLQDLATSTRRAVKIILALASSDTGEVATRIFDNSPNPLLLFMFILIAPFLFPLLLLSNPLLDAAENIFGSFRLFMHRVLLLSNPMFDAVKAIIRSFRRSIHRAASKAKTLYSHPSRKSANPSTPAPETAYIAVSTPAILQEYVHALPGRE